MNGEKQTKGNYAVEMKPKCLPIHSEDSLVWCCSIKKNKCLRISKEADCFNFCGICNKTFRRLKYGQ